MTQSDQSVARRALKAIDRLQARITDLERAAREPIAIVGMACRFPGDADSPDAFWDFLHSGHDALIDPPPERWRLDRFFDPTPGIKGKTYVKRAGYVKDIDRFDARFFGISPREAIGIDPQHRILLEVAFESLENAGIAPCGLEGSRTGVFVGIGQDDYAQLRMRSINTPDIDTYDGTGNLFCFGPGRIAHILGLRGPNVAIDTACSSSLVAIHEACQTLRAGGCDMALAGGVHLTITADVAVFLSQAKVLAPDGRCKTFAASADGFGRGEGCGVVVLKRLSDAISERDRILGVIRGSAVNHDGASSGLTVPNEQAQAELIEAALDNAGVDPEQVSYLEAHGTGTSLGDPIELHAVGDALCQQRSADNPLVVGSVKTNIGHLEAAAGVAGLIKVLLALRHRTLPPHLHFDSPNPKIAWDQLPIEVSSKVRDWSSANGPRLAGISSFGFSGTNAHVIVEEPPPVPEDSGGEAEDGGAHVLGLSARSESAIVNLARRYCVLLKDDTDLTIRDICGTAAVGRSHFRCRLALVARSPSELRTRLEQVATGGIAATGLIESGGLVPGEVSTIAEAYLNGSEAELRAMYQQRGFRRIALPTYPFERERFWVADSESSAHYMPNIADGHPLLGAQVIGTDDWSVFQSIVSDSSPRFLGDHKVFGAVVMPAAAFVEMALAAGDSVVDGETLTLSRVDLERPLILDNKTMLQLRVQREPDDDWSFDIQSLRQEKGLDCQHVRGRIGTNSRRGEAIDLAALKQTLHSSLTTEEIYADFATRGVSFGPAFRCVQRLWEKEGEVLAEVTLGSKENAAPFRLHPALLDACFQAAAVGLIDDDGAYVPVHIERLTLLKRPQGTVWCRAVARRTHEMDQNGVSINLSLHDDLGNALVSIEGLMLRKADSQAFALACAKGPKRKPGASPSIVEVDWQPAALVRAGPDRSAANWLVLADSTGVGGFVADALRQRSHTVVTVQPGEGFQQLSKDEVVVDPRNPADFDQLLEWLVERKDAPWNLVHLWGLDIEPTADYASTHRAALLTCGSALSLLAAHHRLGRPLLDGCWLITQGAQPVGPPGPVRAHLASLWGLEKVIALEQPHLNSRCVDLDPLADDSTGQLLVDELLASKSKEYVAFRGLERFVARLKPCAPIEPQGFRFHSGACYLITGGLGALGLHVARWMVGRGARKLVLCSRGAASSGNASAVKELKEAGADVKIVSADIAIEEDVEKLLSAIRRAGAPLRGVVHAAGVVDDGALENLSFDRLWATMRPKALGLLNLYQYTVDDDLDFLVAFSSAASVIGSGGQGNYAAANAVMDALIADQRAAGRPGVSLAWGAWAGGGMASSVDERYRALWEARGMGSLTPDVALGILGLRMTGSTNVCAVDMDWERYLSATYGDEAPAYFRDLDSSAGSGRDSEPATDHRIEAVAELLHQPSRIRQSKIADIVRDEVAQTLGLGSASEVETRVSLFDQGIDSLMAAELTRRLESRLGSTAGRTAVFNYPTVERLAEQLDIELFPHAAESDEETADEELEDSSSMPTTLESQIADELAVLESLVGDMK